MDRETVLRILNLHRPEIQKLGVRSLALFGSTSRNEATPESDIDILIEFSVPATFDLYMNTKFYLEDILNKKIDLVMRESLKPRLRSHIEREAIYVP